VQDPNRAQNRFIRTSPLAKDLLFVKFVERNNENKDEASWTMLSPDIWLRQQFWQQLWKGPAAVSAYLSLSIQLAITVLSAVVAKDLENPSLYTALIGVLIILVDLSPYNSSRVNASMEANGSSINSTRGFGASERASATRCFMPPES
jgi:hypothetical protein